VVDKEHPGIAVFRGIRYAQPPTGQLRLRPPQEIAPDPDRVVDATRFGPSPPQRPPSYLTDVDDLDEDCLSLNIWTPMVTDTGSLPVLVWLYGGGFRSGATSTRLYDGATLSSHGAVVVSVNYRVGALGFGTFAHRGDHLAGVSNLGLRDVIAALQWIRDNITAFGGDPSRVCVVGQSAGAFLAGALLGAPSADGLYAGLVPMSGGPYKIIDAETARLQGDDILASVGIAPTDPVDWERLQQVPVADWVTAADGITEPDVGDRNAARIQGLAVVDDSDLPDGVLAAHPMEREIPTDTRILLLATTEEAVFWQRQGAPQFRSVTSSSDLERDLVRWGIGDAATRRRILDHYLVSTRTPDQARQCILTDWIFHLPEARAALRANECGAAGWLALVSVPGLPATGHFDDTPHFFGTAPDVSPGQRDFGARYREMVVGFAATGTLDWEPLTMAEGAMRHLSGRIEDRCGELAPMLAAWEGILRG